jgi:lysophospholipase L1-like esterase
VRPTTRRGLIGLLVIVVAAVAVWGGLLLSDSSHRPSGEPATTTPAATTPAATTPATTTPATTTPATTTPATTKPTPTSTAAGAVHYVALGDSFSAGTGSGDNSGSCDRSDRAYPALWARAHASATFTSVACAGATVADVTSSQLPALTPDATLVSLTIGANDIGFGPILRACILHAAPTCQSTLATAEQSARTDLAASLPRLLTAIHARAPRARIVVLGYPHFYDLNQDCAGLDQRSRQALDQGIDVLDAVLAAGSGPTARYADVRTRFDTHEICDGDQWVHSANADHLGTSYHPTASGQSQGYLPALTAAAG